MARVDALRAWREWRGMDGGRLMDGVCESDRRASDMPINGAFTLRYAKRTLELVEGVGGEQ